MSDVLPRRRQSIIGVVTGIQSPTGSELIAAQPLLKEVKPAGNVHCFHCGTACEAGVFAKENRAFCCAGCLTVFELLSENGLTDFYSLDQQAGVPIQKLHTADRFSFLDEPSVRERIVNFSDADTTRVTFRLPAIHCIACVWLLENLFRLKPGIGQTRVDFLRKEASITFDFRRIQLSEVVALLASLGYEPDLNFSDLNSEAATKPSSPPRKLWIQLGVAGFAFGNNMLFSIAIYLGLDSFHGPAVQTLVGYISIVLAIPVLLYSAQDYFRLAWTGLKNRLLTIEVPIALGIMVIFAQSVYEVLSGRGEGYFDSFAGLLFFLLCGRLFQQKTYSRLAFDRDFRSFFPLSVIRLEQDRERPVSLSALLIGDRVRIRNGELIPADSRLLEGDAFIDYSFVTGEAEPVDKKKGDIIYAGGRQIGGTIEVLITKPVSQSYLTSLWNQEAFTKKTTVSLDTLINRYSQVFTISIIALAVGTAVYWSLERPELSLKALTSILIVACPCALALAAPFTLGTAIRVLGRQNIFVKNPHVLERLAQVDSLVFDKTGTLTSPGAGSIKFEGSPLSRTEACWIHSVACHSTHPYAARITGVTSREQEPENVRTFREIPGCGIEGIVAGHELALGSADWLRTRGVTLAETTVPGGGVVHVAVDHVYRGFFVLISAPRRDIEAMISKISTHKLALLSGDNERERKTFASLFGPSAELRFNQSPTTKLEYIRSLQSSGYKVMMIGDGLNDAGALKQSNVGVAVVESIGAFSPASDVIMSASVVPQIPNILQFSKGAVRIVRLSFFISTLYNVVGLTIAAQGLLAPIVCAILMPLSSISVVTFACLATSWWGRRVGLSNSSKGSER